MMTAHAISPETRAALAEALRHHLPKQRWFGARGRAIADVAIEDLIPCGDVDGCFIGVVRVVFGRAERDVLYQVPLLLGGTGDAPTVIATFSDGTRASDATASAAFRRAVANAFAGSLEWRGETWRWHARTVGDPATLQQLTDADSRTGSAEQSNTSLIFGRAAIAKLFRRIEIGHNPDAEMALALTRAGFRHVAPVLAVATLEGPAGSADAAVVQRFMKDSQDSWTWALATARPTFSAAPSDREDAGAYVSEARRLGEVTRALHDALARVAEPDFGARPARDEDVDGWVSSALQSIDIGLTRLDGALGRNELPVNRQAEAKVLARRGDAYRDHVRALAELVREDAGVLIRHHGDYHLGQVLRSSNGDLAIVDFEGEPARPLSDRRRHSSPLRDVAGMLRSFAYAAATLLAEVGDRLPLGVRELRGGRWEREVRRSFLAGYRFGDAGDLLPKSETAAAAALALFETEKAFYELAYEIDNRPDWAWIPMRGISKLLVQV